nr:CAP domain-containing protein [Mycobacterium sherrisii]
MVAAAIAVATAGFAHADNTRLNNSVVANVYTIQHQAGCTNNVVKNAQLQLAAEWHATDVLNNRDLGGDLGSDGSTVVSRAQAAGYRGEVAQTVAINPALAINGIEIMNQWYYDPVAISIIRDCCYTQMGVWSVNSLDRSVVVAVYGAPARPSSTSVVLSDVSVVRPERDRGNQRAQCV